MSINKKNKTNSSLTSASSLVSNALQGRKSKLPIQTIMEGQNATPSDDKVEEIVNISALPLDIDKKEDNTSVEGSIENELKPVGEGEDLENVKALTPGEEKQMENNNLAPEVEPAFTPTTGTVTKEEKQPLEAETSPKVTTQEVSTEKQPIASTKKEKQKSSYQRFLISNRNVQKGKAIYIRTAYHEKIENILSTMGAKGLTLSAYIDNVLTAHFEQHEDIIRELQQESLKEHLKQLER